MNELDICTAPQILETLLLINQQGIYYGTFYFDGESRQIIVEVLKKRNGNATLVGNVDYGDLKGMANLRNALLAKLVK